MQLIKIYCLLHRLFCNKEKFYHNFFSNLPLRRMLRSFNKICTIFRIRFRPNILKLIKLKGCYKCKQRKDNSHP